MSRVGFVLSHEQFAPSRLVDLSVKAEQAGFDQVWASDHFVPWMDRQGHAGHAWVTLAAVSQRTQLPFGTGVTCPTYRYHPAIVAQGFATLAGLAPGRVFLGVGTGEAINEQSVTGEWGDWDERADRLVEAISLIRRLWQGEWVDHQGTWYTTHGKVYDAPSSPIPIYIAAAGPKAAALAGQHGDGLIGGAEDVLKPEISEAFERGARKAGKDPAALVRMAELFVVAGGQGEAEEAARAWRFSAKGFDYVSDPDPRHIERDADQTIPIEQVTGQMLVSADGASHAARIRELFDAGISDVFVHSGQEDQDRFIDFYGREVLPQLKPVASGVR